MSCPLSRVHIPTPLQSYTVSSSPSLSPTHTLASLPPPPPTHPPPTLASLPPPPDPPPPLPPCCSEFPSNTFYEGALQNGITVAERTRTDVSTPPPSLQPPHPLRPRTPQLGHSGAAGQGRSTLHAPLPLSHGQAVLLAVAA
jgi:hypothetical protein